MNTNVPNTNKQKLPHKVSKEVIYNIMIFLLITSVIGFAFLSKNTIISLHELSKIVPFFVCIPFLIPMKFHAKYFDFGKIESAILNVVVGFTLLFISASLNSFIPVDSVIEKYRIEKQEQEWNRFAGGSVLLLLENGAYKEFPEIRRMGMKEDDFSGKSYLVLEVNKGVFGYSYLKDRYLE